MKTSGWFLLNLTVLGSLSAFPSLAVRIGPPIQYDTPAFRISEVSRQLFEIPFQFHPAEGTALIPEFVRGARSPGGSYLASDWRIAAPDRNDRFSVRWLGYWTPEEGGLAVRLSAENRAVFYLDGNQELSAEAGSIETVLFLDPRPHELRVESSHPTGAASVQLEWRIGDETWKPLVPRTGRKKESPLGWNGDYYLGSNFERKEFSRVDEKIDFNWGEKGPFDRAEDTPTLSWRIANSADGGTCGEITANRDGTLVLDLAPAAIGEPGGYRFDFTNPSLLFSRGDSGETVSLQFDREASKFALEEETDPAGRKTAGSLEFLMKAGDSIRFWETGGEIQTGVQASQKIAEAETAYESSRPRLGGGWSALDEITVGNGAWFLQVLRDGATPLKTEPQEAVRLARFVATDLASHLESVVASATADAQPPQPAVNGLKAAINGLSKVESRLRENPEGGLDLWFDRKMEDEYGVERWPCGGSLVGVLCGPNGLRIADATGTFLMFDSTGTVRGFRIEKEGVWTGEVELDHPPVLRAGPAERISGILWNDSPLTLVREGDRVQGRCQGNSGRFRVILRN